MPDVSRQLGELDARMDGHDQNVKRIEEKIDKHIVESGAWRKEFGEKLDLLLAHENQRKGAIWILKFLAGSGVGAVILSWIASKLGVKFQP